MGQLDQRLSTANEQVWRVLYGRRS